MVRLTERNAIDKRYCYYPHCFQEDTCGGEGCKKEICDFSIEICNRLGAYEDTGLEPEEVEYIKTLIPPCNDGDIVYEVRSDGIGSKVARGVLFRDNKIWIQDGNGSNIGIYGESVFTDPNEADKALERVVQTGIR